MNPILVGKMVVGSIERSEAFSKIGYAAAVATDPFSAFLPSAWANLSGWGAFVSLAMLVVIGAFREWWVPGARYRRLEVTAEKLLDANGALTTQNGQLVTTNQITEHFFQETIPKRGEAKT